MSSLASRARLAVRYGRGLVALRRSDVLLASFPRSGSTLLRSVLASALDGGPSDPDDGPEGGLGVAPFQFEALNRAMPELGVSDLAGASRSDPPRFVKTHRPRIAAMSRPRSVWLVRDPLDALASYHRYWTARVGAAPVSPGRFLRDRRRGLPRWIRHTQSWSRADLRLRYARLQADPAGEAGRVLRLAGLEVSPERLAAAAAASRPEAVRRAALAGSDVLADGFVFAADRPAGTGADAFGASDRAWAAERLRRAGLGAWVS